MGTLVSMAAAFFLHDAPRREMFVCENEGRAEVNQ